MTARLRVLVVGAGFMGALHARALRGSRLGVLCGVVDRAEPVAARVAGALGVPAFTEPPRAIAQTRPDAVIIATPDPAHRQPAETAIDAGLAVLVEKPLATTVADAEAIAGLAAARGVRLFAGQLARFHPRYAQVAEAVRGGRLGRPVMVTAATFGLTSLGARVSATTNPLWHFAIHDIDAMQWATGATVATVDGAQLVGAGGLSVFAATGGLTDGAGFQLTAGWTFPGEAYPRRDLKVHCERGVAEATWRADGVTITTVDGAEQPDGMNWPTLHGEVAGALRLELDHFLSALVDDAPFAITAAEAVDAVRSAAALEAAVVSRGLP